MCCWRCRAWSVGLTGSWFADAVEAVGVCAAAAQRRLGVLGAVSAWHFVSRSRSRNRTPVGALVEAHEQVPRLLRDPGTGRVCGDTDDVDVARGELDEEQYVDPFSSTVSTVKKSQAEMVCA
jgi:hypothetical protein